MTDRVSLIVAAFAIGPVRVRFTLPYAVHHGCITACYRGVLSGVSVEAGARVRTILVNGIDLGRVSRDGR